MRRGPYHFFSKAVRDMALVSFCLPVFFFFNLANFHSSGLVGHLFEGDVDR